MSSDALARPCSGTAAGVPYVALPPTAVDAEPTGDTRLVIAWHGMEPPRSAAAFAAAVPMTGVPVWRVYLELPMFGTRLPEGGVAEVRARAQRDYLTEFYAPVVEEAAAELPATLAELRDQLGVDVGPIGLAGFSAGAAAALLVLARGEVPVSCAALITPIVSPGRLMAALERRTGGSHTWTDESREVADRLDLTGLGAQIVAPNPSIMLVAGAADDLVTPADVAGFRDLLRAKGGTVVEAATFKMGHALAAEPGTEPRPPIAEAVSVDAALTEWFRTRLAQPVEDQDRISWADEAAEPEDDDVPIRAPRIVWSDRADLDEVQATPAATPDPAEKQTEPFRIVPARISQQVLTATVQV